MLKVAVDFVLSDVGGHGYHRRRRRVLAQVHCGGDTVKLGHDDVHEDQIEVVAVERGNASVSIVAVFLLSVSGRYDSTSVG